MQIIFVNQIIIQHIVVFKIKRLQTRTNLKCRHFGLITTKQI